MSQASLGSTYSQGEPALADFLTRFSVLLHTNKWVYQINLAGSDYPIAEYIISEPIPKLSWFKKKLNKTFG